MTASVQAILEAHVRELPDSIDTLVEKLLDGISPFERSRARSVVEACAWAGVSRPELYRAVERGELVCERAPAEPRRNGRRAATRIHLTLTGLANFRARRMVAATPLQKVGSSR